MNFERLAELTLIACSSFVALSAIFYAIRIEWPENYHTLDNAAPADFALSASPWKFALFRFGPLAVVSLFAATTASRRDLGAPVLVGALGASWHSIYHAALATRSVLGRPMGSRRGPLLVQQLCVGIGGVIAAIGGAALYGPLGGIVPEPRELVAGVWTAAFGAVVAVVLIRGTDTRGADLSPALIHSAEQISDVTFELAWAEARRWDVFPPILWTLLVVENLQRPPWFRIMERRIAFLLPQRSTGIAQVVCEKPVTDEQSIAIAAKRLAGATVPLTSYGDPDPEGFQDVFMRHNPDRRYGALAEEAYFDLKPYFRSRFSDLTGRLEGY